MFSSGSHRTVAFAYVWTGEKGLEGTIDGGTSHTLGSRFYIALATYGVHLPGAGLVTEITTLASVTRIIVSST